MTDLPHDPDDELVSAVADGEATPAEEARVAADPRLAARLSEFFAVTDAITGPVPLVDSEVRDRHIEAALAVAEFTGTVGHEDAGAEDTGPSPAAPPPPPAPIAAAAPAGPTAPVTDLASARARRTNRIALGMLSAAAAFVVLAVAGALVLRAADESGGDDTDAVAAAPTTAEATADDGGGGGGSGSSEGADDDEVQSFEPGDSIEQGEGPGGAPPAESESEVDQDLPSLGDFDEPAALTTAVQARVADDPTPRDLDPDEPCRDDLPVDVVLIGRAEIDGEEGFVYLEEEPDDDRRVWLVAPSKDDEGCEDVARLPDL